MEVRIVGGEHNGLILHHLPETLTVVEVERVWYTRRPSLEKFLPDPEVVGFYHPCIQRRSISRAVDPAVLDRAQDPRGVWELTRRRLREEIERDRETYPKIPGTIEHAEEVPVLNYTMLHREWLVAIPIPGHPLTFKRSGVAHLPDSVYCLPC